MLFSQLSGHNSADVAVLIAPRLFNDAEGLTDAARQGTPALGHFGQNHAEQPAQR